MIPGGAIISGSGAIGGAGIHQNPDYGQSRDGSVNLGRDPMNRSGRYKKFSDALSAASNYRKQVKDKAIIENKVKGGDDEKNTQGFKISDDATVVEGYRDPGYSITQEGSPGFGGLIGTVGGAVIGSAFGNPMMGANIGGKVGSYF